MKTAQPLRLLVLEGAALSRAVVGVLEQLGLEVGAAPEGPSTDGLPDLLLVPGGTVVPDRWHGHALEIPDEIRPTALTELLRVAMENAILRRELHQLQAESDRYHEQFAELNRIGIALSSERDIDKLQDFILRTLRQLTRADGASLWLVEGSGESRIVRFASTQNPSVEQPYSSFTVPLTEGSMVGYTILHGRSQVIDDAYAPPPDTPFGLGSKAFDQQHRYLTKSMLCVPMRNHEGEVVGAVQLVNAKRHPNVRITRDNAEAEIVAFRRDDIEMIESIASQAAVALDNKQLLDSIQALFEGFVKASVTAIESRDPTTYGHSGRVAALTVSLAELVSALGVGRYVDLHFNADQLKELRYAALLHDFGKVGVRENVLVKEKKLYPSQMDFIHARFQFVQRSRQLAHTEEKLRLAERGQVHPEEFAEIDRRLATELTQLESWLEAVTQANEPSILDEDKASTLAFLARWNYTDISGAERPLLEPDEFHFLSIQRGTLDEKERLEIESHVTHSYRFLTKIPWTSTMSEVPRIAYGHHEKLDGSGYPRHLRAAEIPVQSRMMTIADIYDALTATDRPYKRAVPLEKALAILKSEADEGKLDADLLDVFITKRIYEAAATYRPDEDLLLGADVRQ
ncbi:MAG TPA: HD domain-containing phosphohydrolase [Candidatus Dormibacteraeota bacterium]